MTFFISASVFPARPFVSANVFASFGVIFVFAFSRIFVAISAETSCGVPMIFAFI
jgi:hypothetical protein